MMRFCSCIVVEDDDFWGGGGVEYPVVMPMMAITRRVINVIGVVCRVMVEGFLLCVVLKIERTDE